MGSQIKLWTIVLAVLVGRGADVALGAPAQPDGPRFAGGEDAAVVEAYALAHVSAEDCARKISEIFPADGPAGSALEVVPDLRSNSLIVACPPRTQERVSRVLAEIDVAGVRHAVFEEAEPLEAQSGLQARVIPLRHVDCEEVAVQVRALFERKDGVRKATWFRPANAVLLRSTVAELDQMEAIISQIDVPPMKDTVKKIQRETAVIHLQHANAFELADVLRDYLGPTYGRRRKGTSPIQVIAEERLNSLILQGNKGKVTKAKTLIKQLDLPTGPKPPPAKKQAPKKAKKKAKNAQKR